MRRRARACAGVCGRVRACAGVCGRVRACAGVRGRARACAGVRGRVRACAGVCGRAWALRGCVFPRHELINLTTKSFVEPLRSFRISRLKITTAQYLYFVTSPVLDPCQFSLFESFQKCELAKLLS